MKIPALPSVADIVGRQARAAAAAAMPIAPMIFAGDGRPREQGAVNLFAGAGGWEVGARLVGWNHPIVGIEMDEAAASTLIAAGFSVIRDDVLKSDPFRVAGNVSGLLASPPCFIAGTPVLTQRGSVAIEDVKIGDLVWTHRNRWRPVTNTMTRIADTVRVGPITATADHPFYTRSQVRYYSKGIRRWKLDEPAWTAASKTQGAFLASPVEFGEIDNTSWACDPWLAGRYLADGWTGRDGVMFAIDAPKVGEFEQETSATWAISRSGQNYFRYTWSNHDVAGWLTEHFRKGAANKTLPAFALSSSREVRERLLAGYLSGDGTVKSNGWVANTVSSNLAAMIRLLALSLGYTAHIREVVTDDTTVIEGRTVSQRNYWSVTIKHNDHRYTRTEEGLHWFKQRKPVINALYDTQVYDITVAEDHSFVAWGYVVHNCQGFSMAGHGRGRRDAEAILLGLNKIAGLLTDQPNGDRRCALADQLLEELIDETANVARDPRTRLVLEPIRWVTRARPEWTAWEQVPEVLPLWQACAPMLRRLGYTVTTGVLRAEQYGMIATCPLHSPAEIVTRFSLTDLSRVTVDSAGPALSACLDDAKVAARRATFVHQFNVVARARTGNGITSTLRETVESAWNVAWMLRAALADASDATWHGLVHDLAQRVLSELPIRIGRAGDVSTSADTYVSASTGNTVANTASWPSNTWDVLCALARSYTTSTEPPTTTSPKTSSCSAATHTICSTTGSVAGVASCGVCTDYAVPQTRKRAILIASRVGEAALPTPTHSRYHERDPYRLDPGMPSWVSIREALGWKDDAVVVSNYGTGGDSGNRGERSGDQPSSTVTGKINRNKVYFAGAGAGAEHRTGQTPRAEDLPAHTVTGAGNAAWVYRNGVRPNSASRETDLPAPTVHFGNDSASVAWVQRSRFRINSVQGPTERDIDTPSTPVVGEPHSWVQRSNYSAGSSESGLSAKERGRGERALDTPSSTVTGKGFSFSNNSTVRRITVEEAGQLQTFPADHPWQGNKGQRYQQVGNAIPPLLAGVIIRQATTKGEQ